MMTVAATAQAQLSLDINSGTIQPLPIGIPAFEGGIRGNEIPVVIANNLKNSGLFRPVAVGEGATALQGVPDWGRWENLSSNFLVKGAVMPEGNQLRLNFVLFDVLKKQQLLGLSLATTSENWRRLAHMASDAIYKRITGEDGYFDTRIVYVSETGSKVDAVKRLAVMDQDGFRHRYLTNGSDLVLTPRFSPTEPVVTFLSYREKQPAVFMLNIDSGRIEKLGNFPGMTFAPRYSPDGRRLVFTQASQGNSDIYEMNLITRQTRRLTNNPAIDTSASYSPDGNQIVFTSDRGGRQAIYVMSASGGNAKRITFGRGDYSTPVWSPRGDLIAFTKATGGMFHIGVMRPDGSGERLLTQSYLDEGPTWAPNGRVLMFFRENRGAGAALYTIDLTGSNLRRIPTPARASDPAWSGLNPNY